MSCCARHSAPEIVQDVKQTIAKPLESVPRALTHTFVNFLSNMRLRAKVTPRLAKRGSLTQGAGWGIHERKNELNPPTISCLGPPLALKLPLSHTSSAPPPHTCEEWLQTPTLPLSSLTGEKRGFFSAPVGETWCTFIAGRPKMSRSH